MARSGFNDDQNNPRYNFVPHPVSSNAERGIAAVNKLVSRADFPGTLEICTSTSPDPTLYGGGTWQQIGGAYHDIPTVTLSQGVSLTTDIGYARYRLNGAHFDAEVLVSMHTGGSPGAGDEVVLQFDGLGINVANLVGESRVLCGVFCVGDNLNGVVKASSPGTSVQLVFSTANGPLGVTDGFLLASDTGLAVSIKFEATPI